MQETFAKTKYFENSVKILCSKIQRKELKQCCYGPAGYVSFSLVCRGRQTTARGGCNVQQKSLYQFLKISFKFKKCAISNKSIQNGRPSRSPKKDKKKSRKKPENPEKTLEIPEDSARDPRRTENCHKNAVLCHLSQKMTQKKEVSFRRLPKEP